MQKVKENTKKLKHKEKACMGHRKGKQKMQLQKEKHMLRTRTRTFIARQMLGSSVESTVITHDVGHMNYLCCKCGELMFKGEQSRGSLTGNTPTKCFSLCCSYGAVKLSPIKEPPEMLKGVLTGNTKRDHDFRTNIRA